MSQQASLLSTATTYPTLPRNKNLHAKLEELICGHHVFIGVKMFGFFFPHESTATGFLDCSSVGPLGSSLLRIEEVPLSSFGASLICST